MSNPRRGGRAGQEEEGERTSVGANGTFAAVSNVKRRMLASTDAYITSTWDDLAGGFQWGLTPPVGSIPCYANLSTVGLGVVDRGSKIIPRSAGSLLFLRFSFFSVSFFFFFLFLRLFRRFLVPLQTKRWPARLENRRDFLCFGKSFSTLVKKIRGTLVDFRLGQMIEGRHLYSSYKKYYVSVYLMLSIYYGKFLRR